MPNRNPPVADPLKDAAADGLENVASTARDRADDLPGGPRVQQFAHATADSLGTTADYVRSHEPAEMMRDIGTIVKSHPGPALVVAAAFGFLLGRALSRD
jgi:ElaB/YqjD/DUF883 family membrane-anchored ribosome-binding protein